MSDKFDPEKCHIGASVMADVSSLHTKIDSGFEGVNARLDTTNGRISNLEKAKWIAAGAIMALLLLFGGMNLGSLFKIITGV